MLKTLELRNFRKHRSLTLNFSAGLQVLRGANEAGKSTIVEAILYALFGARNLRESIGEVVTYDEPVSSLRVTLTLDIDGVEYICTRGSSGAEVRYGEDGRVTGQTETSLFMQNVLRVSAKNARLLMIAEQGSVKGILNDGAAGASSLVEKLANLSVVDDIISAIQAKLPSGNTQTLVSRVTTLRERVQEPPKAPDSSALAGLTAEFSQASAKIEAQKRLCPASKDVVEALGTIEASKAAEADYARLTRERAQLEAVLAVSIPEPALNAEQIAELKVQAANDDIRVRKLRAYSVKFPAVDNSWDGTYETLCEHIATLEAAIESNTKKFNSRRLDFVHHEAKLITQTSCALCGKDLKDVPEVSQINLEIDEKLRVWDRELHTLEETTRQQRAELAECRKVKQVHDQIVQLAGDAWALSDDVPPKATWVGPAPAAEAPDYASQIREAEKEWRAYQLQQAQAAAARQQLVSMTLPALIDRGRAETIVAMEQRWKAEMGELQVALASAEAKLKAEEALQAALQKQYAAAVQAHERDVADLEAAEAAIRETLANNELIKKLRDARLQIAAKLWGLVLGAISTYFSSARGESSVLTRTADGFQVNGRSVEGLSGSTNDMLGLAIRFALSKVFLPTVPFVFLDESFSGCDSAREIAGLGTIARAGFTQTFLVTHSDLADTLADNLLLI